MLSCFGSYVNLKLSVRTFSRAMKRWRTGQMYAFCHFSFVDFISVLRGYTLAKLAKNELSYMFYSQEITPARSQSHFCTLFSIRNGYIYRACFAFISPHVGCLMLLTFDQMISRECNNSHFSFNWSGVRPNIHPMATRS